MVDQVSHRKASKTKSVGLPTALLFGVMAFLGFWAAWLTFGKATELSHNLRTSDSVVTRTIAHKSITGFDSYHVYYEFRGHTKHEQVWRSVYDPAHVSKRVTIYYSQANPDVATIDRDSFFTDSLITTALSLMFAGLSALGIWQWHRSRHTAIDRPT